MTASLQKTPEETFDRARFNDDYIEQPDGQIRRQLDLRPAHYSLNSGSEVHPDRRPCPSWCYIGQNPEYDHEVDQIHPLDATHHMDGIPHVVASQYEADFSRGNNGVASASTLEPRLEQVGQDEPLIHVGFRRYEGRKMRFDDDLLRLSLTDARELARVLNHLVDVAS